MKIFDWVQRKLHGKVDHYKVSHNEESFEENKPAEMEMANAVLLEQDHVIGSTLLTIGTFGHFNDGFHPMQEEQEYLQNNKVEEEIVMDQNLNPEVELEPIQVLVGKAAEIVEKNNLLELEPLLKEEPKKDRTTLADLFLESDGQDQSIDSRRRTTSMLLKIGFGCEKEDYSIRKAKDKTADAKMQRQFSKKEEEISGSKTSKKLHQLITKIVIRKKIHPEADNNMQRHNKKKGTYQSICLICGSLIWAEGNKGDDSQEPRDL